MSCLHAGVPQISMCTCCNLRCAGCPMCNKANSKENVMQRVFCKMIRMTKDAVAIGAVDVRVRELIRSGNARLCVSTRVGVDYFEIDGGIVHDSNVCQRILESRVVTISPRSNPRAATPLIVHRCYT